MGKEAVGRKLPAQSSKLTGSARLQASDEARRTLRTGDPPDRARQVAPTPAESKKAVETTKNTKDTKREGVAAISWFTQQVRYFRDPKTYSQPWISCVSWFISTAVFRLNRASAIIALVLVPGWLLLSRNFAVIGTRASRPLSASKPRVGALCPTDQLVTEQ